MRWPDMREEVRQVNVKLGWWDEPVSFKAAMTLLHSEVSEILEAWRDREFQSWEKEIFLYCHECEDRDIAARQAHHPPKPEGFASEFADVLIRLLDDDERFNLVLAEHWHPDFEAYTLATYHTDYVPDNLDDLHNDISRASMEWESMTVPDVEKPYRRHLATLLTRLQQLANLYGVDLQAEYTRKMAFNKTRPYRHGKAV